MTALVTVRHNFETGHRLPVLGGKCQNLHGHSWWAEVTISAQPGTAPATVVEFGAYKAGLREWIDTHLDHGLMLGKDDPLASILPEFGKAFIFDPDSEGITQGLAWPTVENVAALLARVAGSVLEGITRSPDARVVEVRISETHVNAAHWRAEE